MGGVIELNEGGLMQNIERYLGISEGDWDKKYFLYNHLCNSGQKSYEEVFALTAKEFGASADQIFHIHAMVKKDKEAWRVNLELVKIIKDLKKNYKIGLLSNNSTKLRQKLERQRILDLFDVIVISEEVGYQKPSPEIFEYLFKELNLKADEIVFVDDTEKSLEGAEDIGYIPILFKSNKELKEELEKLGVKLL